MKPGAKLAILVLSVLLPLLAWGQNGGQVSIQTVNVALATATSAGVLHYTPPGGSATSILPNIGQSSHWLSYCTSGSITEISVRMEASFDGSNWFPISELGTLSGCQVLEAGGYFPEVRANLVGFLGSGSVTAWYSASDSPIVGSGAASATRYTAAAGSPFLAVAKSSSAAYFTSATFTNPGASKIEVNVSNPNGYKSLFPHRARVSCSAACKLAVVVTSGAGTCSAGTATDTSTVGGPAPTTTVGTNCSVNPTIQNTITVMNLPAGSYQEIDLEGYVAGTSDGIAVENVSALTGELDVTVEWYEN